MIRGTVTYFGHKHDKPPWYEACPHMALQPDRNSELRPCMKKAIKVTFFFSFFTIILVFFFII